MRLTRLTLLLITLVLTLGFYQLTHYLLDDVEPQVLQATEEVMVDAAQLFAELAAKEMTSPNPNYENLRSLFHEARLRSVDVNIFDHRKTNMGLNVYVTDAAGVVRFDSDDAAREGKNYIGQRDVYLTLHGRYGARSTREDEANSASSIMYVAAPIGPINKPIGVLTVFKKQRDALPMIIERRKTILQSVMSIAIGILLLIAAVFWWVYHPIGVLTEYARAIEKGQRPQKPKLGAGREVNSLYQALETMREALEGRRHAEHYTQTLTHELKSPLAAIRGASELLHEDMPAKDRTRFLDNIRAETSRAERLLNRLTELSIMEGKTHLDAAALLDFREVVQRAVSQAESLASLSQVRLITELPTEEIRVKGDAFVLRSAVTNLLENALDFSPPASSVVVTLSCANGNAILQIEDEGPGVPDYAKEKIFERFFSLRHHQHSRKGTGLGLNLVKEAAELHFGSISLVNRHPKGALAELRLPLA